MQNTTNTQDKVCFFFFFFFFFFVGGGGIVNNYKPLIISTKQVHPRRLQRSASTSEYVYL